MEGFRQVDDADGLAVFHGLVQRPDALDVDDRTPVGIFLEGRRYLALALHRHHLAEVGHHRGLKAKPVTHSADVEHLEVTGRRNQRSVEGVGLSVKVIDAATECPQALLKLGLLRLVVGEK